MMMRVMAHIRCVSEGVNLFHWSGILRENGAVSNFVGNA